MMQFTGSCAEGYEQLFSDAVNEIAKEIHQAINKNEINTITLDRLQSIISECWNKSEKANEFEHVAVNFCEQCVGHTQALMFIKIKEKLDELDKKTVH